MNGNEWRAFCCSTGTIQWLHNVAWLFWNGSAKHTEASQNPQNGDCHLMNARQRLRLACGASKMTGGVVCRCNSRQGQPPTASIPATTQSCLLPGKQSIGVVNRQSPTWARNTASESFSFPGGSEFYVRHTRKILIRKIFPPKYPNHFRPNPLKTVCPPWTKWTLASPRVTHALHHSYNGYISCPDSWPECYSTRSHLWNMKVLHVRRPLSEAT